MTRENKIMILKGRINKLRENNKNIDSNGVLKKLTRQLRNLEANS